MADILTAFPRRGFEADFLAVLVPFATAKPDSVARTFLQDVALRYGSERPPAPNFCDVLHAAEAEFEPFERA